MKSKSLGAVIYRDSSLSSVQAVALEPTPIPKYYWSILHPDSTSGRFICLNVHLVAGSAREPHTDQIARVRVYAQDGSQQKSLGDSPVESDGSFYLAAPADRPTRFELLGRNGQVVRAQQSWIWVRPGEDHACLGCHADPAMTPANHWALALKRASGPTELGVQSTH